MAAWRMPGAPRHGIGYAAPLAEEDAGAWRSSPPEEDARMRDLLPEHLLRSNRARKRRRAAEAEVVSEEDRILVEEPPQPTVVRASGGLGCLYGSAGGGMFAFGDGTACAEPEHVALEPESAASRGRGLGQRYGAFGAADPEAFVWPTFRDLEADEEFLDGGAASPEPSPPSGSPAADDASGACGASGARAFAAEVRRVLACAPANHRGILGLVAEECGDAQAIQSRYRHLMRLLHPDKRRADEEEEAGGKARCNEAVGLVQKALAAAKKAAQDDPRLLAQSRHARMQEEQRLQARQAPTQPASAEGTTRGTHEVTRLQEIQRTMARQAQRRAANDAANEQLAAPADVGALLASLSRVTAGSFGAPASTPPASNTTAQIMGLLAGLR